MANVVGNFSAGPSALPQSVRAALSEFLAPDTSGTPSLVEVSHRGMRFGEVAHELRQRLHALLGTQDTHELLFLQGGASMQFAQWPMNFGYVSPPAYVITGHWGEKAFAEAERLGSALVALSTSSSGYTVAPKQIPIAGPAAYLHYTGNETIHGVQYHMPPKPELAVPLVGDLSSEFLSKPYPYSALDGFYAGAQKNLGVAGLTIVGIRQSWLAERNVLAHPHLAKILDFSAWLENDSMLNTPCTFAWWVALLMLRWLESCGGLGAIEKTNLLKASLLYECIDSSGFYRNPVNDDARSTMNVPFWIHDSALEPVFVAQAEAHGLLGLKGHRAVGGLRASLYNAIDEGTVRELVEFMREFERIHG
jgi:phosphoserine aminotransferase